MGRIIGIDLGTTTFEIAYIKNGKPEIIVNDLGSRITPSVVGLTDDNEIIIGSSPKRQAVLKPERTVMEVKRLMGSSEKVTLGEKEFSPQQISAMILEKSKKYAEDYLGEVVTEAVITVPANFNDLQRQATKEAGALAGLKVERIINEPTAAALAYGINNLESEEKVLVYDLGGGTFDVTILELFEGVLDVKASRGNNMLGGKDFDERIENYIIKDFKKKHGIDLSGNKKTMARIKDAAERAKIELSSIDVTDIELPFVAIDENQNPLEINIKLTRNKFEELIMDLVESTDKEIQDALIASGYNEEDIDVVLAVGGSSRIPCVKRLLNTKFNNKIKTDINPDEAVALGAAVQAGIKNDEISSEDSVLITDVCRYTLGTNVVADVGNGRLMSGIFDPIIMRDSKIPCTAKKTYYTMHYNQTSVDVDVYQGEAKLVIENTKIGEFVLEGIPEAPAGEEAIEVAFTYNLNGILEVTAKILSNQKSISKIIDTQSINKETTLLFEELNLDKWKECKLAPKVKSTISLYEIKQEKINETDLKKIQKVLNKLKKAVIDNDEELVEKYDEELTDLLFDIH
ncbi:molecular chaperone DnaK [Natranaerovirga pectinivora]|uniref:Chaperone protein DnaK n=1 Tax=Natranaerovirga pectinivora TaxID=682400 RepID=A0A4R3MM39_9FIRM|nr:Hsp70 family protein [Natranaerovirga pectinivora]TCT15999.1 molecular chaperone DnaK [Natranaerovirga pectinivora]